jgi:hypothetical protein
MKAHLLEEVCRLCQTPNCLLLLGTTDGAGRPHIAAGGTLSGPDGDVVHLAEWFCPATVSNLIANRQASLVIWDPVLNEGYQLHCQTQSVEVGMIADGYDPDMEGDDPMPQVQRVLDLRVSDILFFRSGAHGDRPEEALVAP